MPTEVILALGLGVAGAAIGALPRYVRGSVTSALIGGMVGFALVTFGSSLRIADGAHGASTSVVTPYFEWRGDGGALTVLAVLVGAAVANLAFWLVVTVSSRTRTRHAD
jgi:hypothetical protein